MTCSRSKWCSTAGRLLATGTGLAPFLSMLQDFAPWQQYQRIVLVYSARTQQELAYLVGLSRQRVNEALRVLEDNQLIRIEYGGLRILDLHGLRTRQF